MALTLPNLDNRTYADLVAEAIALIPTYAPEWTNHNPSDPGIMLIELLAYFTEMQIYQVNRITQANEWAFLHLIKGPDWKPTQSLEAEKQAAIQALRESDRAITVADFKHLALAADRRVARVHGVPRRNLVSENQLEPPVERPGHMSIIIIPDHIAFDTVFFFDGTAQTYNDRTSADGMPFPLNTGPHDFLYVGATATFGGIVFHFDAPGSGYTLHVEYFDGQLWRELEPSRHNLHDGTGNWTANGMVEFTIPETWVQTTVNQLTQFWVRIATGTAPEQVARAALLRCDLLRKVRQYLEPRRLITSRVHVVGSRYCMLTLRLTLVLKPDAVEAKFRCSLAATFETDLRSGTITPALWQELQQNGIELSAQATVSTQSDGNWLMTDPQQNNFYTIRKEPDQIQLNVYDDLIRNRVVAALQRFFDPLTGGPDQQGWPFGRAVYVSEIYALLDTLPDIDYITRTIDPDEGKAHEELAVNEPARLQRSGDTLIAVALRPDELVRLSPDQIHLTIKPATQ